VALEPSRISDFQVLGPLGAGSTARVFAATHLPSGRPVAIKMLEPGHEAGSELRERFAREALLLAGVESKHVSRVLGFGFERGQPFIVLERLEGETLDARLRREGPIPMTVGMGWVEQLLLGVRDVHACNVIHRDLKPSNIFLQVQPSKLPSVKLIDFGVARLLEVAGSPGLTSANHLVGSMGYMAPEQFRSAHSVGFAADLFAVGVVVFRMATGQLPFVSRSIEQLVRMKCERDPPLVSSIEGAPRNTQLDWFVGKAMQRDPAQRFRTAREMLEVWQRVMPLLLLAPDDDLVTSVDARPALDPGVGATTPAPPPSSAPDGLGAHPADDHEPTIPGRPSFADDPHHHALESSRTDPRMSVPRAPSRFPSADAVAAGVEDGPTRNDPGLQKIVAQELERARRRGGAPE
jgi:serine/threonine-protein kinase